MRQPNFGRPLAPLVAQHLHDDAVDGLENGVYTMDYRLSLSLSEVIH